MTLKRPPQGPPQQPEGKNINQTLSMDGTDTPTSSASSSTLRRDKREFIVSFLCVSNDPGGGVSSTLGPHQPGAPPGEQWQVSRLNEADARSDQFGLSSGQLSTWAATKQVETL